MPQHRAPDRTANPVADSSELELHSPEELLFIANQMLKTRDSNLMRAVVMESITALEAFVGDTVFPVLAATIDPSLSELIKDKTRMDFDTRLHTLVPAVLGRPIDRSGSLWSRYKNAKEIRNRVSHSGRRIAYEKAKEVYDTAYDWLAYLGSVAEVDLALLRLKSRVESGEIRVINGLSAEEAVRKFFASKKTMSVVVQPLLSGGRPDVVLQYGGHRVYVETKYLKGDTASVEKRIMEAVLQSEAILSQDYRNSLKAVEHQPDDNRGAIVIFSREPLPHPWGGLRKAADGRISTIGIQTERQ